MCKQPTQRARAGHPSPGLTPAIPPQQRGFAGASGAERGERCWGVGGGKGAQAVSPGDPGVGVRPLSPERPPRLHTPARAEPREAPGWLVLAGLGATIRTLSEYALALFWTGPDGVGPSV